MVISDLKELKKLLQLGRSEGLESLKIDNIEIKFGTKPVKQAPKPCTESALIVPPAEATIWRQKVNPRPWPERRSVE